MQYVNFCVGASLADMHAGTAVIGRRATTHQARPAQQANPARMLQIQNQEPTAIQWTCDECNCDYNDFRGRKCCSCGADRPMEAE